MMEGMHAVTMRIKIFVDVATMRTSSVIETIVDAVTAGMSVGLEVIVGAKMIVRREMVVDVRAIVSLEVGPRRSWSMWRWTRRRTPRKTGRGGAPLAGVGERWQARLGPARRVGAPSGERRRRSRPAPGGDVSPRTGPLGALKSGNYSISGPHQFLRELSLEGVW